MFATNFPYTPRIVAGHVGKWPQIEKTLDGHSPVISLAMSPDGKQIVCGFKGGTIQAWDIETGYALGAPLQGYAGIVASVASSPDGKRIVLGSYDSIVRVWDVVIGNALGAPLRNSTRVHSVAISRDGTRIVAGLDDLIVRVWDAEAGKRLGDPLGL